MKLQAAIIVSVHLLATVSFAQEQDEELAQAVSNNNVEAATRLLDSGIDPNHEVKGKLVPLHLCRSRQMVELFLERGACTEMRSPRLGLTPLELHCQRLSQDRNSYPLQTQKRDVISALLQGGSQYTDKAAIYLDDVNHFSSRLANGDWIKSTSSSDALGMAIDSGSTRLINAFLNHGVDPNGDRSNPHLLRAIGNVHVFKSLLNHGASVHRRITISGGTSGTPIGDNAAILHYACRIGSVEIVKLLVAGGADPNAQDSNGQTPLHFLAVFHQQADQQSKSDYLLIARMLIADGGCLELKDQNGQNAFEQAFSLDPDHSLIQVLKPTVPE